MSLVLIVRVAALAGMAFAPAFGQSEAELKAFFEGKRVIVKIEMPANKSGIDVNYGQRSLIDFRAYSARIKQFGTALRPGESSLITTVKVKDKLIEFQLGGGGYGTLGDDTSTNVPVQLSEKSRREKKLEKDLREETDSKARKRMERELDDLRRERNRGDAVARAVAAQASQAKEEALRQRALGAGSRFNLRFPDTYLKENPPTPELIMRALAEWVDFSGLPGAPASGGAR
jgi:hypothetical protein